MPINYGGRRSEAPKSMDTQTRKLSVNMIGSKSVNSQTDDEKLKAENATGNRSVYVGFISGTAFFTTKGFRGNRLDSLWSRYIYESFTNDDSELCSIALKSCLADVHALVSGGLHGSPFYIGNFAFYSTSQFDKQSQVLEENERNNINPALFLSPNEWDRINNELHTISKYAFAKFENAVRGDSFLALAIRRNAFDVALYLLTQGIDPIIENENKEDTIMLIKVQAYELILDLRDCVARKEIASKEVILPSAYQDIIIKNNITIERKYLLMQFIDILTTNLIERLELIEQDKRKKRLAELRKEDISYEIKWNISNQSKIEQHIQFLNEVNPYLKSQLESHIHKISSLSNKGEEVIKMAEEEEEKVGLPYSRRNSFLNECIMDNKTDLNQVIFHVQAELTNSSQSSSSSLPAVETFRSNHSNNSTNSGYNISRYDQSHNPDSYDISSESGNHGHKLMNETGRKLRRKRKEK